MEDFKVRLRAEIDELLIKLEALDGFIYSTPFYEIDKIQQDLLVIQHSAMETYLNCLQARL
jgi:hypothetical protein